MLVGLVLQLVAVVNLNDASGEHGPLNDEVKCLRLHHVELVVSVAGEAGLVVNRALPTVGGVVPCEGEGVAVAHVEGVLVGSGLRFGYHQYGLWLPHI